MLPITTLTITHSKMDRLYPQFSKREILCGYNLQNKETKGRKFIRTSSRFFDIEEVISQLNENDKKIDLMVLSIQVPITCFPKNLYKVDCPKIAIVNETDHQMYPISSIIKYLKGENIEHILASAQAAHLHFFYEAGIKHSALYPRPALEFKPIDNKKSGVTYIGKKWKSSHLRRSRMIQFLKKELPKYNIPFHYYNQVSYSEWLKLLSQSKIFVISSLNGQLTPQIYKALSTGALCLVDEISHQTFLYNFFESGKHLITWTKFSDLLNKIIYFYKYTYTAEKIAKMGKLQALNKFVVKDIPLAISNFVFEDKIDSRFLAINDKRCQHKRIENKEYFNARVRLYENIQELHRIHESLKLISLTNENINPTVDLADLPRLKITHLFYSEQSIQEANLYFQKVGILKQIKTNLLSPFMQLNKYNIGILETKEIFTNWLFYLYSMSKLLKKSSILFVFGEISPFDYITLRKEGFKRYKLKNNFIKEFSRKIIIWFWKKGKYPFPYLTIKPAMETVPNLNIFIRGWQSKIKSLY